MLLVPVNLLVAEKFSVVSVLCFEWFFPVFWSVENVCGALISIS